MILDIDAGNTRSKWRVIDGDTVISKGVFIGSDQDLLAAVESALSGSGVASSMARVRIASVRDNDALTNFVALAQSRWGIKPEFAKTTVSAGGLTNSYAMPQTMGVDRWCAAVAAAQQADITLTRQAFCVIDAGSALTVECVDGNGIHCGGYIAPGFAMQLNSLLSGTDRVFVDDASVDQAITPANNTNDAVLHGVLLGMCALTESAVAAFSKQVEATVQVYITGGDGMRLQRQLIQRQVLSVRDLSASSQTTELPISIHYDADLVLNGLAILLP